MTASIVPGFGDTYFNGLLYFDNGVRGWAEISMTGSHKLEGILSGSVLGLDPRGDYTAFVPGTILSTGLYITGNYMDVGRAVTYSGFFDVDNGTQSFEGNVYGVQPSSLTNRTAYQISFLATTPTGSIFQEFVEKTSGNLFGPLGFGLSYRKEISMLNYPKNAVPLNGYMPTHYKYSHQQFSPKEINSYQVDPYDNRRTINFKWKKGSQNKKTTVDPTTGLLDNSDPIETKTV
jgi:hypothetical protein